MLAAWKGDAEVATALLGAGAEVGAAVSGCASMGRMMSGSPSIASVGRRKDGDMVMRCSTLRFGCQWSGTVCGAAPAIFTDILSGYRAFSRRFVKSFPAISTGFEIETEMSVHASQLRLPVAEVDINYGTRPDGSTSKLRTVADGTNILLAMLVLLKDNRPLAFFGWIASTCWAVAIVLAVPLAVTYADTGLVPRMPTVVLATGLVVVGLLLATAGVVLDSIARARLEAKRLAYLAIAAD